MTLCSTWEIADTINTLILIVYIITGFVIYITFREGKRQTTISLSIGQYNIMKDEFADFFEDAKSLTFKSELGKKAHSLIKPHLQASDGINYMSFFMFATNNEVQSYLENGDKDGYVQDFRHNIIFPLERYYDKLYNFILSILDDKILEPSHKNSLIKKIERDILQNYFRVCNFGVSNTTKNYYQLQLFKTEKYNPDSFYRINNLFIEKNLFQYKDLDFYQKTT